jgi:hypothetical protein
MVAGDGEHVQGHPCVDRTASENDRAKGTAAAGQVPSLFIAVELLPVLVAFSFSSVGPLRAAGGGRNAGVGCATQRDAPQEGAGASDCNMWGSPPQPVRLPCSNEAVLRWVLAPQDESAFLKDIWERKPLHIAHKDAQYFKDVMTLEDLEDVLLNTAEDEEFGEMLTFKDQQQVYYDNAFRAYLDGASVVINHVDKQSPPINLLCQALGHHFPHAFANMYLTPPNSQAVHPHSDDRDVLLLQIWGKKHWKVYGSPQVLPYTDEQVGKRGVRLSREAMGPETLDCLVEQGDVLYIPRGFVHEAHAHEAGSLHLTVAIPTQDFTWAVAALDAVKAKLRRPDMCKWRRCVPLRLLPGGESEEEMQGWRDELAQLMHDALAGMTVECVREVLDDRMAKHRLRQRQAPLPHSRHGSHVRYKEGLLLASHVRAVRGVGYRLVEAEAVALGPQHAPGMVQPPGGGGRAGEAGTEAGQAGAGAAADSRRVRQARDDSGRDSGDEEQGGAGVRRADDKPGWMLAVFEDASGKRMQWRMQPSLADALHFCFSAPMVQVGGTWSACWLFRCPWALASCACPRLPKAHVLSGRARCAL